MAGQDGAERPPQSLTRQISSGVTTLSASLALGTSPIGELSVSLGEHPQSAPPPAPSEREPGFEALVQTDEGHEHGPFFEGAAELARLGMCLRTPMGATVYCIF